MAGMKIEGLNKLDGEIGTGWDRLRAELPDDTDT
jgi:hypothetical protein